MSYNQFTPGGSYQKTSRNISVTISAECQKRDGSWMRSPAFFYTADEAQHFPDIANDNGVLVPLVVPPGKTVSQNGVAIPAGSYQLTSRNIVVTLNAECQKRDGSWQRSAPLQYDTKQSAQYPDGVVNNDGELSFTM